MSFKSRLGLWRMLEFSERGLTSWSGFGYGEWSVIHTSSKFRLYILMLKLQRKSKSIKSWLEHWRFAVGSWLWFCIQIDHSLNMLRNFARIFPDAFITLVSGKIRYIVRLESDQLRNIKAMSGLVWVYMWGCV